MATSPPLVLTSVSPAKQSPISSQTLSIFRMSSRFFGSRIKTGIAPATPVHSSLISNIGNPPGYRHGVSLKTEQVCFMQFQSRRQPPARSSAAFSGRGIPRILMTFSIWSAIVLALPRFCQASGDRKYSRIIFRSFSGVILAIMSAMSPSPVWLTTNSLRTTTTSIGCAISLPK